MRQTVNSNQKVLNLKDQIMSKENTKNIFKSIATEIDEMWDSIPTPIKITIYVMLSAMLTQGAQDVLDLQKDNLYLNIVLMALNNILLWVALQITTYISKLKTT